MVRTSHNVHVAAGSRSADPYRAVYVNASRISIPDPEVVVIPVRPHHRPVYHQPIVVTTPRRHYAVSDQRAFRWALIAVLCILTLGIILIAHHDLNRWANRR